MTVSYARGGAPTPIQDILPEVVHAIASAAMRPSITVYERLGRRGHGDGTYVAIGSPFRSPIPQEPRERILGTELLERAGSAISAVAALGEALDPTARNHLQAYNQRTLQAVGASDHYVLRRVGADDARALARFHLTESAA